MNKPGTLHSEMCAYQEEPSDVAYNHYVDEVVGGRGGRESEKENGMRRTAHNNSLGVKMRMYAPQRRVDAPGLMFENEAVV
jgi:hypothetical protein